ncbi:hypothetical protein AHAS_Ahas16G0027400 [Arachis hypogaea]
MGFMHPVYRMESVFNVYRSEFRPIGHEDDWPSYDRPRIWPNPKMMRVKKGQPVSSRIQNNMDDVEHTGKKGADCVVRLVTRGRRVPLSTVEVCRRADVSILRASVPLESQLSGSQPLGHGLGDNRVSVPAGPLAPPPPALGAGHPDQITQCVPTVGIKSYTVVKNAGLYDDGCVDDG